VPPENYREVAEYLKEEKSFGLDMFIQLTCVDWPEHFDIIVHLLSCRDGHKLFIRCPVNKDGETKDGETDALEIETISDLYQGAEWHEREVYDMFGVRFRDHPDMRRIFLKKDFPVIPCARILKIPHG
jgi:NADH:ubiquinone oxidoreductase subunit C